MERLTTTSGDMVWMKSQDKPNLYLEPCELAPHDCRALLKKLAEYEDAEEKGNLIRLPYEIGQKLYYIYDECNFVGICEMSKCTGCKDLVRGVGMRYFNYNMLPLSPKRKFYLTEEEANEALKKYEEEQK